ncbi:MAG TPA: TRAP transporter large permease [Bilophila wadsworthia]|uniref:TRAP transporter large permease n=1 Tax=Bilophila wadsworthia TaxID=35833 RepID=UPI001DDC5C9D|nr:TRAP transporter large permease [Bilophila wadsworthia]HJH16997.1 TRAP transporter large permease [Bilophila wadsworthia]
MLFGFLIVGCLCIGLPIFIALGIGPLVELILNGEPLEGFAQTLYSGVDQYTLMAIPCFVLAGAIMGRSGITQDLVDMMKAAVGKVSGGLAIVTILACTFFAAISGSGPGTVAAVGALLIPAMKKERYDEDFAAAVSASGGVLGVLIPPSNPLIVYGVITSASIGDLFIAGIVPGLLMSFLMMGTVFLISQVRGYAGGNAFHVRALAVSIWNGKYSLMMPVIVLGGIYTGMVTPVEAAVVAVLYALVVAMLVKRTLTFRGLWDCFTESSTVCGGLTIIMGTAVFFGEYMTMNMIPQSLAAFIIEFVSSKYTLLIIICIFLLIIGTFMETLATTMILTPILLPVITTFDIDVIQFGVIMVVTNAIGMLTPPLGLNLFVACNLTGLSLEQVSSQVIPFICALILGLALIAFIPWLSLVLL